MDYFDTLSRGWWAWEIKHVDHLSSAKAEIEAKLGNRNVTKISFEKIFTMILLNLELKTNEVKIDSINHIIKPQPLQELLSMQELN